MAPRKPKAETAAADVVETVGNPHAKEAVATPEVKQAPAPKMEQVAEDFVDETQMTRQERMARLNGQVNGKALTFPVGSISHLASEQISMDFVFDNLKDGQKFTINPHRLAFFFLPECGISLNTSDSGRYWTYNEGDLTLDQLGYFMHAVRSRDILVGELPFVSTKPKPSRSLVDCNSILSRPYDALREEVKSILGRRQTVSQDGSISSPGIDLKALLKYETENDNRKPVVKLLNTALTKIGGMVEFLNQFDDEEDVVAPRSSIPSQGSDFVNSAM